MKEIYKNVDVYTLEWNKSNNVSDLPQEPMIYQIYGDSPIYGTNTLLYIGKTNGKLKRPYDHEGTKRINNFSVRYAKCNEEYLDLIESILISSHKPSYNKNEISNNSSLKTDNLSIVFNENDRGLLNLEVSNMYF